MAEVKHSVHVDMGRKLLRIRCVGFWTIEDVHDYDRTQRAALREMTAQGCSHEEILVLIDCSKHVPQALDVISELNKVLSSGRKTGKVAVLVSSALVARQSGRSGPEHRIFYDEDEAMNWLLAA